jgi:hypothetical protein
MKQLTVWNLKGSIDWELVWENGLLFDCIIGVDNAFKKSTEISETQKIPEYTFNWKRVEVLNWRFSWYNALKEAEKRWLRLLTIDELEEFRRDYSAEFPKWGECKGEIKPENPLWLRWTTYWSSSDGRRSGRARELHMLSGSGDDNNKSNDFFVVCVRK